MGQLQRKRIDIYEEKMSAEQAYEMYLEGKIVFPKAPITVRSRKIKKVSDSLEEILMGLPFPPVYASELQDGRLLILDTSDVLRCLFDFFSGKLSSGYMELYPELEGYHIQELEEEHPRITSIMYHYPLKLQVIDYLTPKYLHMQVGSHVEKWNFSREQGVRNALYGGGQAVDFLERLSRRLLKIPFFSRSSLNRQYMVLRILMYRLVVWEDRFGRDVSDMGLQMLLDQTFQTLEKAGGQWLDRLAEDFLDAAAVIAEWNEQIRMDAEGAEDTDAADVADGAYDLLEERGKEQQARALGYCYNIVWLCHEKQEPAAKGLTKIAQNHQIWDMVENDAVNYGNIIKHWIRIQMQLMK